MRRYCGRPGCSAPASVTFTFDATARLVWLDPLADGTARAGDLCTRHADALVPPQGWSRVDRRPVAPPPEPPAPPVGAPVGAAAGPPSTPAPEADELLPHREPKRRRRRSPRWSDVPSLFDDLGMPVAAEPPVLELVEPPAEPTGTTEPTEVPTTEAAIVAAAAIEAVEEIDAVDEPSAPVPAWEPRFEVDDLGGLLDAKSPLLSRAFRAAKAPEGEAAADDEVF